MIFLLMLMMYACHNTGPSNGNSIKNRHVDMPTSSDSNKVEKKVDSSALTQVRDSIYKIKMLKFALKWANENKDKDHCSYKSQKLVMDSGSISIDYGHLFDNVHKDLIIRIPPNDTSDFVMELPVNIYLYIYRNGKFDLLCVQNDSTGYNELEGFCGDTIEDVNGDGARDFVVRWYSGCGCCPRDDERVFFYDSITGTFSKEYSFLNPTFLPGKKMVYLMDYGYPTEIGLYKCIWKGFEPDTIEMLTADRDRKNTYYVSNPVTGKEKRIRGIPMDYSCVGKDELDWFSSAWDK